MPNKFSSFSPSGRKDLLEKLTKSDFMVEDIRQRVNTRQLELSKQLRDCEDSLLIHITQNKSVEATLKIKEDELLKAIKPDFTAQIAEITAQLDTIKKDIISKTDQVTIQEQLENTANTSLVKLLEDNTAEVAEEKEAYDNAFKSCFTEKTRLEAEIRSLNKTITDLKAVIDICPTCGQKLPGAVKPDTSVQEKELEILNQELTTINDKLNYYNCHIVQICHLYH